MAKRVVLVGFDGAEGLDLFGPAEVFTGAGRRLGAPAYDVIIASAGGGSIVLTSGASVATRGLASIRPQAGDTVLVVGGADRALDEAASSKSLILWLVRASRVVRRIGSVCDGAFVIARAGILDGRRAATHWSSCDRLGRSYPRIKVDREAIFVHDGRFWRSAGVTTGIDMALAMVEADRRRPRRAPIQRVPRGGRDRASRRRTRSPRRAHVRPGRVSAHRARPRRTARGRDRKARGWRTAEAG
jgi:transcriptional regulator GlxA family with amidase domain